MRTSHISLVVGTLAIGVLLTGCAPKGAPPQSMKSSEPAMVQPEHIVKKPADLQWVDAPPSLPAGAKLALLEGDPSKPGPFTMRIMVPANYRVPPHSHPADEHVTVISGTFSMGMGDTFSESALNELSVGSFAMMRTGVNHFAWSRDGAIIQLHGVGPWGLKYVNPQDDPRNK